ncbi:hypothetical protein ACMT4L_16970 [Deinococcus sp. A31D244]|uniref:hypothetical protein n=1 Tax=Deinococcus sp. A31D244 TaxID=3397675 RepID=UPI0039DFA341
MKPPSIWTECFDTPDTALTVTTGLIVITGDCPILLLPGMTWPGTDALSDTLGELILPDHLRAAGGTSTRPPTPEELAAAPAHLAAQVLRTLSPAITAPYLEELTGANPERATEAALILGCSRETVGRATDRTASYPTLRSRVLAALTAGPLDADGILAALSRDGHPAPSRRSLSSNLSDLKRAGQLTSARSPRDRRQHLWSVA